MFGQVGRVEKEAGKTQRKEKLWRLLRAQSREMKRRENLYEKKRRIQKFERKIV